jgi:hypothetical protein
MSDDHPKVEFKYFPAPWEGNYIIEGWEEFDRWCQLNIPVWRRIDFQCRVTRGVTEADRLRLLLSAMTEQYLELQKQHLEIFKRAMFPPVVLNPT